MTTPYVLISRALELALDFADHNAINEPTSEVELLARAPVKCQGKEVSINYSLTGPTAPRMDMKGNVEKVWVRVRDRHVQYVLSRVFEGELAEVAVEHFWRAVEYANAHTDSPEAYVSRFKDQSEVKAWAEDYVQAYFKCLVSYLKKQKRAKQKGENK